MYATERRSSTSRSAHEAELEDIVATLEYLDSKELLNRMTFVAANLNRLPGYLRESTNICTVVDKQVQLDHRMDQLSFSVDELRNTVYMPCELTHDGQEASRVLFSMVLAVINYLTDTYPDAVLILLSLIHI